jgi:plastocyanin
LSSWRLWMMTLLAALTLVGACTKRRTPPTAPQDPGTPGTPALVTVRMLAVNRFVPEDTTVARGDTVLWVNHDTMGHTTTSGACAPCVASGLWNSGNMPPGASFRVVFGPGTNQPGLIHVDSSGVFPYYCIPHQPGMAGSITVTP